MERNGKTGNFQGVNNKRINHFKIKSILLLKLHMSNQTPLLQTKLYFLFLFFQIYKPHLIE